MNSFLIAAVTADGFIARHDMHGADWTSAEDKKVFVHLTKKAGVMVMGAKTFATIGRALPGRRTIVYTNHPENITVEGIETTTEDPLELIKRLEEEGAEGVAICGGATIYDQFLQAGAADEIYLTVEPKLFGSGINLFTSTTDIDLELIEAISLNKNVLLLHYKIAS